MKEFSVAQKVLKSIIIDDISFPTALKIELRNEKELPNRPFVGALVGCELRHHLIFSRLVLDNFKNINEKSDFYFYLLIAFANNAFAKRYKPSEISFFLEKLIKEDGLDIDIEVLKTLLGQVTQIEKLIPEDVVVNSPLYLSYRFNTPLWLVKMWQKHYGRAKAYKILRANARQQKQACLINTKLTKKENLLNFSEFSDCSKFDDVVFYNGKTPLRKLDFFQNFDVIAERLAVKDMMNSLPLGKTLDALQYSGSYNTIFGDLAIRYDKASFTMELAVPSLENRLELKRFLKLYNLTNIRLFEAKPNLLLANVSTTFDVVFATPESSNFEFIRLLPDYLLHFKQSSIDELIRVQKEAILECSKFVNDDGYLVYAVSTLSIKEGHFVVMDFLRSNTQFSLEIEKQYFPFDGFDSTFYYALLKKTGEKVA